MAFSFLCSSTQSFLTLPKIFFIKVFNLRPIMLFLDFSNFFLKKGRHFLKISLIIDTRRSKSGKTGKIQKRFPGTWPYATLGIITQAAKTVFSFFIDHLAGESVQDGPELSLCKPLSGRDHRVYLQNKSFQSQRPVSGDYGTSRSGVVRANLQVQTR
ncbi:MAG: hypothetical protein K9K64_02545 [Desulfohalobiaceae bacterium]|nr:hypothetical protein [Desulfohalobiaceae bacterium]